MTKPTLARLLVAGALLLPFLACDDDEGSKSDAGDASRSDATATDAISTDSAPLTDAVAKDTPAPGDTGATDAGDAPVVDAGGDTTTPGDGGASAEKIARGKYLVDVVASCPECHTPRLAMGVPDPNNYLAGHNTPSPNCEFKNPVNQECIYPRNLTNDATGLKNRTDAEIKNMIMNGKRPIPPGTTDAGATEEALHPVMPYYVFKNMTEDDADAIVAYLRTVPAKERTIPRRGASFDIPAPAPALPVAKIPLPRPEYPFPEAAMRGRYLTSQVGLCAECHTVKRPPGSPTVLDEDKLFWGGDDFTGFLGPMIPIKSKNITSDMVTGLGAWSFEQVATAIKDGKDREGKGICPPMPAGKLGMLGYGNLKEQDASDIVHYIRSLPPATNMIADMCVFPPM